MALCTTLLVACTGPAGDKTTGEYSAAFKVKADYLEALATAAYTKTNAPAFLRPKGGVSAWEPWPIHHSKRSA